MRMRIQDSESGFLLERKPATSSDVSFARHIHHAAYLDVVVRQFGQWNAEMQNKFFEEDWASGPSDIIMYNGICCGYSRIDVRADYSVVCELVILPEFQRKGIGTAILRQVISEAEQRGIPVKIGALKENRALELYRRLGFRDVDSSSTHIGLEYRPIGS